MTQRIVINECFGGFGLSPLAIRRMAELEGHECYFFECDLLARKYTSLTLEQAEKVGLFTVAFDIPNPGEVLAQPREWHDMSLEEKQASNALYRKHELPRHPDDRTHPLLIQVVDELKEAANGRCAKLKIVEIPDGVDWEIDDYDGSETIHEKHRSWD